ncbi:MAG: FAD-dependent oxidoreductase, partial [Herpetosiphonaceae bacterium]|nr:FAD-dependent oxidoreductase [Herpetosiphonaceae bacterium]
TREGIETLVVERSGLGGQAGVTERLDNYPGFPEGVGGSEFADRLVAQCRRFGVELLEAVDVTEVAVDGQYRVVKFADGNEVRCYTVLLAPGSTYRRLGVPGEEDFTGAGAHFCATCDEPFYRGQEVFVVGGGNSATEEAVFPTKFASHVLIVTNEAKLTSSKGAQQKVLDDPKISVRYQTAVAAFQGAEKLTSVVVRDVASGQKEVHPAECLSSLDCSRIPRFCRGPLNSIRMASSRLRQTSRPISRGSLRQVMHELAVQSNW